MANNSSAGVYVREEDQSLRAANAPTSIGAIVGESHKGPVGKRTLVTDTSQFLAMFGQPDASVSFMHYSALAFLEESNRLYVLRVAPESLFGGMVVSLDNALNTASSWTKGEADPNLYAFTADDLFVIHGADQGTWNDDLHVIIYPNTLSSADNTFYVDVYQTGLGRPLERHLVHLNYKKDGYGVQINIEEYINKRSAYIKVVQNRNHAGFVANPNGMFITTLTSTGIAHGSNGRAATPGEIMLAWDQLMDPETVAVNILINGGYTHPGVQSEMDSICKSRMDCIAVLDAPATEQAVSNAIDYRRNVLMLDSSYSALYSPDYLILDKYNDRRLYVPPSGFVAAAYARTDNDFETWFAPAGVIRGKLNITGVRFKYNQGDRDVLVDNQINPTRVIPGVGIKIWGADTLQTMPSALSNVSVRRLMMFLETSLSEAALYAVFDPNDPILRAALVEVCNRFLKPIQDGRGIYSFEPVCDDTNNTNEIVANGDLMLDVYIDPVLPAKRIHLNAIVNKTGARFNVA